MTCYSNIPSRCWRTLEIPMAWFRRRPERGLIHHSDRGSQYASQAYQAKLAHYGMRCSMSRKARTSPSGSTSRSTVIGQPGTTSPGCQRARGSGSGTARSPSRSSPSSSRSSAPARASSTSARSGCSRGLVTGAERLPRPTESSAGRGGRAATVTRPRHAKSSGGRSLGFGT